MRYQDERGDFFVVQQYRVYSCSSWRRKLSALTLRTPTFEENASLRNYRIGVRTCVASSE